VTPQRYLYFDVAVGLVWSNEPVTYAGDSIAIARASSIRHVDGDDPDKKGYPGPPGWGLVKEVEAYTKIL
jgi:hypothetical protein